MLNCSSYRSDMDECSLSESRVSLHCISMCDPPSLQEGLIAAQECRAPFPALCCWHPAGKAMLCRRLCANYLGCKSSSFQNPSAVPRKYKLVARRLGKNLLTWSLGPRGGLHSLQQSFALFVWIRNVNIFRLRMRNGEKRKD